MKIKDIKSNYSSKLKLVSPTPMLEIDILLAESLGKDATFIYKDSDYELSEIELERFNSYIERRIKSEPIAYILGFKEFYGNKFRVNPNVLIPRPESEALVDLAFQQMVKQNNQKVINVLDIGTGSGCIIISIAKLYIDNQAKFNKCSVNFFASDISVGALEVAKLNAKSILGERHDKLITFKTGSLLEPWMDKDIDIIVANLPYIPKDELETLSKDIKDFEPRLALDGGEYGFKLINQLKSQIKTFYGNESGISLILEIQNGEIIIV